MLILLLCGLFRSPAHASDHIPGPFAGEPALSAMQGDSTVAVSFFETRVFRMTHVSVPLIAAGVCIKGMDTRYRSIRSEYLPDFSYHLDDWSQYFPAAVMLGLKAGGIESRSSWGRMLVSDAFSVALMAAIVNPVKYISGVRRPDGSNNHSFPSGHTATAFMTATMLSREYGYISPWISVGAYSVATMTGLSRMMNNKHWLSDVLCGAGVGIISTELGYWFSDLIFGDRGENIRSEYYAPEKYDKPHFISLYTGLSIPTSLFYTGGNSAARVEYGGSIGVEGAYFFTPYVGIGALASISQLILSSSDSSAPEPAISLSNFSAGAYFSYPFSPHVQIGAKALLGYSVFLDGDSELLNRGSISPACGLSFTFRADKTHAVRAFVDYSLATAQPYSSHNMGLLTVGANVTVTM